MLMPRIDDYVRALLDQAATEQAFLDGQRQTRDAFTTGTTAPLASATAVSLMITNRQRAVLRELGFSDEAVRLMTPAEAHAQLGVCKPSL